MNGLLQGLNEAEIQVVEYKPRGAEGEVTFQEEKLMSDVRG
jgi:hypothetical protein